MIRYFGNITREKQLLSPIGKDLTKHSWPWTVLHNQKALSLGYISHGSSGPWSHADTGDPQIKLTRKRNSRPQGRRLLLKTPDQGFIHELNMTRFLLFPLLWHRLGKVMPLSLFPRPLGHPLDFGANFYFRLGENLTFIVGQLLWIYTMSWKGPPRRLSWFRTLFGRPLLLCLGINTNEAMIRDFSLILEILVTSPLKQQLPNNDP